MITKFSSRFLHTWIVFLTMLLTSCERFLDVGDPLDKVSRDAIYSNNLSAAGVLTGIYFDMQSDRYGYGFTNGKLGISFGCALSADELNVYGLSGYGGLFNNDEHIDFWSFIYKFVYRINAAIEGISSSEGLSENVRKQLMGEALFLRAFCYFYLVNLYGEVPLLLTSDYKQNSIAYRIPEDAVYQQIQNDLKNAKELLSSDFVDSDGQGLVFKERVRPTKWAAAALLSRVYLYLSNWRNAIDESSSIIDNKSLFDTVPLLEVFLKNNKESIWQLQSISEDGAYNNPFDGEVYFLANGVPDGDHPFWIGTSLLQSFEASDMRKGSWLGIDSGQNESFYYPFKYKSHMPYEPSTEYLVVFRLGEQYLIRSEARAELGDLSGANADLNLIRTRAGLNAKHLNSKKELLDEIIVERRKELFLEWGHRWFDLKRTGSIDVVMMHTPKLRDNSWAPYKKWYPLPINDIKNNKNLIQNEGYPAF